MTARVKLLAFAGARDIVGQAELDFDLGDAREARAVMDRLCEAYPALVPHRRSLRLAVNGSYAADGDPVAAGDEVALIPPVAGG